MMNFYIWVAKRGLLFESNSLADTHIFVIYKTYLVYVNNQTDGTKPVKNV